MKEYNTMFSPAEILLPRFADKAELMEKWAVIACDQFTSEPDYWKDCREIVGEADSTYKYIMPEAYLDGELEISHSNVIKQSMTAFDENNMQSISGVLYVKRTLPNGSIRHGLVGKIDLEAYDYSKNSTSPVRATEATVIERIPPRCKIRSEAVVELPHILILIDDKAEIFTCAEDLSERIDSIYDFDLMLGGGHIQAFPLRDVALDAIMSKITDYESDGNGVVYAMGDGNHSLAAAKAHWENVKKETGIINHPARYALCELTALSDESLVFEPIYRIVKNCNTDHFLSELSKITTLSEGNQRITVVADNKKYDWCFKNPSHALTVGTLQNFIDAYISENPEVTCDYIHGEESLQKLSAEQGTIGFLFDGMDKSELFPYVENYGALPRKTFSMGEAESKRYYIEMRKITK